MLFGMNMRPRLGSWRVGRSIRDWPGPAGTDGRQLAFDSPIEFDADGVRYVCSSMAHKHMVDRVPAFEGMLVVTRRCAVFVAEKDRG